MTDEELILKYVSKEKQEIAFQKLKEGYPVQYIIGNVDFFGCNIEINEDVLIPRFETEYLVEKTLNYLKKLNINNPLILEIGTGSGCISIALKKNIDCNIKAIDISAKALDVAKENAALNKVKINFLNASIETYEDEEKYDLIISNPPYVPYNSLVDEKIKYEPKDAIYAKDDGLYFYKIILEKLSHNLKNNYLIAFEIGDKEGDRIKEFANKYLPNAYFKLEKDYNNYERYVFISSKNLNFEKN